MRFFLFLLVVCCLTYCKNSKPSHINQNGKAASRELVLHLAKQITLQEHETVFGPIEITGFQIVDDKMYVLDGYKSQQAYIFSLDGSLLSLVGGPGQGPGEYRRPGGFCRSGDRLHLTTGSLYNIYDLEGKYLKSCSDIITGGIPAKSHPGPISSAYYTTYSRYAPKATIYQVSAEGDLLKSFSPVDEEYALFWDMVLPLGHVLVKDEDVLQIFNHKYEVKIFDINGKLKRKINLATGIYNPPDFKAARNLGTDKKRWSEFAKEYTLVNNFFSLNDGFVTGLMHSTLGKDREVLEFWDKDFMGLGRCLVPDGEMLVGTNGDALVFYNGDTHVLSFKTVGL